MDRLTESFIDELQKIKRCKAKSPNIEINSGGDDFEDIINKLAAYEDLEEQGLLLNLLCKVGDTVWVITAPANYSLGEYKEIILKHPQEKKIQLITIGKNGVLYHVKNKSYSEEEFGKTVFLMQVEAEAALNKMKREFKKGVSGK